MKPSTHWMSENSARSAKSWLNFIQNLWILLFLARQPIPFRNSAFEGLNSTHTFACPSLMGNSSNGIRFGLPISGFQNQTQGRNWNVFSEIYTVAMIFWTSSVSGGSGCVRPHVGWRINSRILLVQWEAHFVNAFSFGFAQNYKERGWYLQCRQESYRHNYGSNIPLSMIAYVRKFGIKRSDLNAIDLWFAHKMWMCNDHMEITAMSSYIKETNPPWHPKFCSASFAMGDRH